MEKKFDPLKQITNVKTGQRVPTIEELKEKTKRTVAEAENKQPLADAQCISDY